MCFFRMVNGKVNHRHYDVVYKLGINKDPLKFNPTGSCRAGGLYSTDIKNIWRYSSYGNLVASVSIPKGAQVYKDPDNDKWKADQLFIHKFETLESFWQNPERYSEGIKHCGLILQYVKEEEQSHALCLTAVQQNGRALQYVKKQTHEICLEAVKNNGHALKFVREQTHEICLQAVKSNGMALQYVKEQTHDICLEAVKQNKNAISLIRGLI